MWRIITTLIIAVIVLVVAFGNFGFASISEGVLGAIKEIPFVGTFAEMTERILGVSSGNIMSVRDPFKDFIKLLLLAILMNLVGKVLDWIMEAFDGKRLIDKIVTKFNKLAWQFVFTMIAVLVTSVIADQFFDFLFRKLGNIITYIIGVVLSGGLVALLIIVGLFFSGRVIEHILIEDILVPLMKLVCMLWLYVAIYVLVTQGFSVAMGSLALALIGIAMLIESVTGVFTKEQKK